MCYVSHAFDLSLCIVHMFVHSCELYFTIIGEAVQCHLTIALLCRIAPHVAFTLIFVATLPKLEAKIGL